MAARKTTVIRMHTKAAHCRREDRMRRYSRTTPIATPSCVGTRIDRTRGSVTIRRLNSRTAVVFSSREFGVTLFDLDREELTVVRKHARHPDRRIAAQRSHLEHAPRSDGHEQNLQKSPFVRRDGNRRQPSAIGLLPQRREELILRSKQASDVVA